MTDRLPLAGIRVIDASRVLAGPVATMLLADLGADVVKVEPPEGDETRVWGPPWWGDASDRRSAYFASVNRNKRSIVLDLRTDPGRATMDRLLASADLLVHNYRPATARRLGLSSEVLGARHPALVVASVGGFPEPDANRPAYDLLAQAASGLMSVTGAPDGEPTKAGVALLDLLAGVECALGALAGLVGRGRARGHVGSVEVGLLEVGVTSLANVLGNHLASGHEPGRHGNAHANIVPYQAFDAADGPLVVAVGNDAQFARLLAVLGLDPDPRHATNPERVAARDEVVGRVGERIAARHRAELLAALAAADIPAGPVNTVSEALEAMGGTSWTDEVDGIRLAPTPFRLDGARPRARRAPPLLGQHTAEILAELDSR